MQYRIDRGTDNSFVEYPLGILLYDTEKQIQWVNPYFVEETGFDPSNSMNVKDISSELSSLIDDEEHADNKTIQIDDSLNWFKAFTDLLLNIKTEIKYDTS